MTEHTNEGLGARIQKAIDTAAGMSQTKLAGCLGTTSQVVNAWIKKGVVPEGRFLVRIPQILKCDANWLLNGRELGREGPSLDYVAGRLAELLKDLNRDVGAPSARAPQPKSHQMPQSPGALRARFLSAIHGFTDLQVEEICGINHETVRQYRRDDWPERGPNRASTAKILAMIERHEVILKEDAILSGKKLPTEAAGLIEFAEDRHSVPAFVEKHPKLGWIYLADELAKAARSLDRMTIYDEFMWLGYKRAHHFDPETASRVTPEDVGIDVPKFFETLDGPADSNE